jgi:hypothetical protein
LDHDFTAVRGEPPVNRGSQFCERAEKRRRKNRAEVRPICQMRAP